MAEQLAPCSGCARHVRVSEPACPFCGTARAVSAAVTLSEEPSGLSRAAILVLGASLAMATACNRNGGGATTMVPGNNGTANAGQVSDPGSADIYGGPPPPAAVDGGPPVAPPVLTAADGAVAAPPSVEVQAYGSPTPPPPLPDAGAGGTIPPRRR